MDDLPTLMRKGLIPTNTTDLDHLHNDCHWPSFPALQSSQSFADEDNSKHSNNSNISSSHNDQSFRELLSDSAQMMKDTADRLGIWRKKFARKKSVKISGHRHKERFPAKVYKVLEQADETGMEDVIGWASNGVSFKIQEKKELVRILNSQGWKLKNWDSFQRQLNHYGFKRIAHGPFKGNYTNQFFVRGRPKDVERIDHNRSKSRGKNAKNTQKTKAEAEAKESPAKLEYFGYVVGSDGTIQDTKATATVPGMTLSSKKKVAAEVSSTKKIAALPQEPRPTRSSKRIAIMNSTKTAMPDNADNVGKPVADPVGSVVDTAMGNKNDRIDGGGIVRYNSSNHQIWMSGLNSPYGQGYPYVPAACPYPTWTGVAPSSVSPHYYSGGVTSSTMMTGAMGSASPKDGDNVKSNGVFNKHGTDDSGSLDGSDDMDHQPSSLVTPTKDAVDTLGATLYNKHGSDDSGSLDGSDDMDLQPFSLVTPTKDAVDTLAATLYADKMPVNTGRRYEASPTNSISKLPPFDIEFIRLRLGEKGRDNRLNTMDMDSGTMFTPLPPFLFTSGSNGNVNTRNHPGMDHTPFPLLPYKTSSDYSINTLTSSEIAAESEDEDNGDVNSVLPFYSEMEDYGTASELAETPGLVAFGVGRDDLILDESDRQALDMPNLVASTSVGVGRDDLIVGETDRKVFFENRCTSRLTSRLVGLDEAAGVGGCSDNSMPGN